MKEFSQEAEQVMIERFGRDTIISLATTENATPYVRYGNGVSLGYFGKKENCEIADKLKKVFAEWIDNGHTDFNDENTIILQVELSDGLLLSHGTRYEF